MPVKKTKAGIYQVLLHKNDRHRSSGHSLVSFISSLGLVLCPVVLVRIHRIIFVASMILGHGVAKAVDLNLRGLEGRTSLVGT